jgi:glycosyltransferase involved in cell wall biosynthesis
MKVVHVSAYFAPAWNAGGPARSVLALCQAQRAAGIDVEVFTTTANGAEEIAASPEGTTYEGVPVRYFERTVPKPLFAAASMRAPLRAAMEHADVAHVHGLFNATVWLAAREARRRGVPYVVSPRGMLEEAALRHHALRKRLSWQLFDRPVLTHAALWHATSPAEAASLRRRHEGVDVAEIPNPVALQPSLATGAAERRADDIPSVLFLGRLHPIKRLDLVAAGFARVLEAVPDARLVIAGPDELGTRAAVEVLFRPFASQVQWTGAVDGAEKRRLLEQARALVLCSDSESFGMSVAEAMSMGTPVVVTKTCPWSIVETEGCGFWVDQTTDAIADALTALCVDPVRAGLMGERGRRIATREFAPESIAARWHSRYETLLRGAAPRAVSSFA